MRLLKQCIAGAVGLCLLGGITLARAAGVENITFSGFLSAGAAEANRQVIQGVDAVLADGSVQSKWLTQYQSRFGLQVSANVNPNVSMTGQLLAVPRAVFGSGQDYSVFADWAYIKYRFSDKVSMRVGRVKLPSFLISDYYEVGYAYPWLRPPLEMYSANPMTGLNGVDFLVRQNFGDYSLLVQPFYGSNSQETTVPAAVMEWAPLCSTTLPAAPPGPYPVAVQTCNSGTIKTVPFSVSGLRGINLSLGSDIFTVRASWFRTRVYQSDFGVNGDQGGFSSAGFTMDWKNIVVYTEGFIRTVEGAANIAFPNQEGGYATIGYRFGKFLPHFTYGWIGDHNNPTPTATPTGSPTAGTPVKEKSLALGLRYELGRGAALKFDITRLTPDKNLSPLGYGNTYGLLVGDPNGASAQNPGDSVYIYGAGIDVVF